MDLHDHRTAVAALVFAFQRNQRLLIGDALQQAGSGFLAILGRHEIPDGTANHLFGGESEELALGLIDAEHHSVAIHFVAGDGGVLEPALKMALAIAELLLQALRRGSEISSFSDSGASSGAAAGADMASLHAQNATLLVMFTPYVYIVGSCMQEL